MSSFDVTTVDGIPEITPGMNLGALIATAADGLADGAVIVISQKIVSKAEDRLCDLGVVEPTDRASELAEQVEKDPRVVELILGESQRVIRATPGVLIVRTWSGLVCANAGIDASNVPGDDHVLLLPEDPDASARRIRGEIRHVSGHSPAVVIADSFGRAWRLGQTDVAIGCAGLEPIDDWRGRPDRDGRELSATAIAVADQVAGAADLVRDKAAGAPVAVVRGLERHVTADDGPGAVAIQRPEAEDLFS